MVAFMLFIWRLFMKEIIYTNKTNANEILRYAQNDKQNQNKMKNLKLITICLATMLTFSNCKKYEEGNNFSIRTKKHRVVGEYSVAGYTINGANQLTWSNAWYIISSCSTMVSYFEQTSFTQFNWSFTKDNNVSFISAQNYSLFDSSATYTSCTAVYNSGISYASNNGTWNFISDTELFVKWNDNTNQTFDILMLTENGMRLRTTNTVSGNVTEILLRKQ